MTAQPPTAGPQFPVVVQGTTCSVIVHGEIDLTTAGPLAAALDEAFASDADDVVLDLTAVAFIDSSGLRVIVDGGRRARSTARRLVVVAGDGAVRRLLELCGLERALEVAAPQA